MQVSLRSARSRAHKSLRLALGLALVTLATSAAAQISIIISNHPEETSDGLGGARRQTLSA